MKPRIAILFSGQIRSNSLNDTYKNDSLVNDSVTAHFLNEEFKSKYDYDIFISTDTIDISGAIAYFGESHLKNIHLFEKNVYLHPISAPIPHFEALDQKFRTYDFEGKYVSGGNIMQMYRILDVCNLMEDCESSGCTYDLMVRCRLDTMYVKSVVPLFEEVLNSQLQALAVHDFFIIGRPPILKHFMHAIEHKYMLYRKDVQHQFDEFVMKHSEYYTCCDFGYKFSPEVQTSECFFEYCIANNLIIGDVLRGCGCGDYIYIHNRAVFA
jgi:hypothetical protein